MEEFVFFLVCFLETPLLSRQNGFENATACSAVTLGVMSFDRIASLKLHYTWNK